MTNSKQLRKLITIDITEFFHMIPVSGSILCLDLGDKRIGLAICNDTRSISTSLKTLERGKLLNDISLIKNIISENSITSIIVGRPVNLDGKPGKKSQSIRRLSEEINKSLNLPLLLWDERFSSQAVEKILINELNLSRKKRQKIIDSSAACWILDGATKALKNLNIDI
ncbi:Holliday junction resolvase RuvX [Alphaproteobacteria bacterium]|nr:Holliday junction resolvase RuvX [Alphaproteobacteria bacterium]